MGDGVVGGLYTGFCSLGYCDVWLGAWSLDVELVLRSGAILCPSEVWCYTVVRLVVCVMAGCKVACKMSGYLCIASAMTPQPLEVSTSCRRANQSRQSFYSISREVVSKRSIHMVVYR